MAQSKPPRIPNFSGNFNPKFDIALNLTPAFHFRKICRIRDKEFTNKTEVKRLTDHLTLDDLASSDVSVNCISLTFNLILSHKDCDFGVILDEACTG
jgi:hypothetical protein